MLLKSNTVSNRKFLSSPLPKQETDQLIRSAPLLIDTSDALVVSLHGTTTTTSTTTTTTTTSTTARPQAAINRSVIEEIEVVQEATAFESAADVDTDVDDADNAISYHQTKSKSALHRQHSLWPIYSGATELPENSKEVLILGVFVAILAFVLIVLTVVILVRRKQDQIEDREQLIENEVLPKILHV